MECLLVVLGMSHRFYSDQCRKTCRALQAQTQTTIQCEQNRSHCLKTWPKLDFFQPSKNQVMMFAICLDLPQWPSVLLNKFLIFDCFPKFQINFTPTKKNCPLLRFGYSYRREENRNYELFTDFLTVIIFLRIKSLSQVRALQVSIASLVMLILQRI